MFEPDHLAYDLDSEILSPAWISRAWADGDDKVRRAITRHQSAREAHWQRRFDDPQFDHECRNPVFRPMREAVWLGDASHDPGTIDPDAIRPAWLP